MGLLIHEALIYVILPPALMSTSLERQSHFRHLFKTYTLCASLQPLQGRNAVSGVSLLTPQLLIGLLPMLLNVGGGIQLDS